MAKTKKSSCHLSFSISGLSATNSLVRFTPNDQVALNNLFIQGSTHIPEKLSGWSVANRRLTYLNPGLGNVVFQFFD